MSNSETVTITRRDFEELVGLLKQQKHHISRMPNNGGQYGVIGQIDELLKRLGQN